MVSSRSFLVEFKYSHKVAYIVEFSHKKIRLFNRNSIVRESDVHYSLDFELYEGENKDAELKDDNITTPEIVIESPYGFEDLWDEVEKCCLLQTIQHSDVLYIFNENHPIMMLKRYSNISWKLEELEIVGGPFMAMNTSDISIKASATEGEIELEADGSVFVESDVGRLFRLRNFEDSETKQWVASNEYSVGDYCLSDNKYYVALNGATSGNIKPVHSVGVKSDGGVRWRYVSDGNGVVKVLEYISSTKVKAKVMSKLSNSILDGTLYWEKGILFN
ncbi:MAG: hypothetical protein IKW39_00685, partial [Alphaproteobacteria bacterium]|nr:hypothetical protein [Alphaproteobacteria bacterium]